MYQLYNKESGEDNFMYEIRKNLLMAERELSEKCKSYKGLIEQLKNEGKSMSEIEKEIMEFITVNNLYTAIEKAVRKY